MTFFYNSTFVFNFQSVELITPILNYGSELWGFKQSNAIEGIHLQFCKRLLGVKKTTQNDFVYGELGRTNYQTKRYLLVIKYWFKILLSDDRKYIKIIYKEMLNDFDIVPNTVNWVSLVRHLLLSLGFYEVWMQQGVGNIKSFISLLKQSLTDTFI